MIKLLYVEDNDDNLYMLKMRLELLGDFEVLAAEDGEKGCQAAAAEQPDIILMDLEMPVVDGWEAARRLKSNPQTSSIPIIGLSAHRPSGRDHPPPPRGVISHVRGRAPGSALRAARARRMQLTRCRVHCPSR